MSELKDLNNDLRDRVQALRLPDRANHTGRSGSGWLPWALCLLLAASSVSLAARVYSARPATIDTPAPTPQGSAPQPHITNQPTPAPSASGAVVLESKGYVIPAHQIQVSPIEVSGLVTELYIEEGKRVKKGDVLAVLDKTSFEAEAAEARAAVAAADARYSRLKNGYREEDRRAARSEMEAAEADLVQAKADFARVDKLYTNSPGITVNKTEWDAARATRERTQRRYDAATARYDMTINGSRLEDVAEAAAELDVAKARSTKAEWRLQNCTIRAPIDGTILTKKAELGTLVSPMSFNVSASLCDMADLSDLEVELDITERDVAKVKKGMPCRVRVEAFPDRPHDGYVSRLMPTANRAKGAVPVRVKVKIPKEEEGLYLKPEMGAVVAFLQPEKKK